jgi:hypothetical protein
MDVSLPARTRGRRWLRLILKDQQPAQYRMRMLKPAPLLIEILMRESEKVMFEIYREASYNRRYKVVYFTELNEHNKESEINRAMAGDHFLDGFLNGARKDDAKAIIDRALMRLNEGEQVRPDELERELDGFLA